MDHRKRKTGWGLAWFCAYVVNWTEADENESLQSIVIKGPAFKPTK